MNSTESKLKELNLDINWLTNQIIEHKLDYQTLSKVLNLDAKQIQYDCNKLGIESIIKTNHLSNYQMLNWLRTAHDQLGYLNRQNYDKWVHYQNILHTNDIPYSIAFDHRFISFEAAINMIGIKIQDHHEFTKEEIKYHLQKLTNELNTIPRKEEIDERCPFNYQTLIQNYKSIEEAIDDLKITLPEYNHTIDFNQIDPTLINQTSDLLTDIYPSCSITKSYTSTWLHPHKFDYYIPEMAVAITFQTPSNNLTKLCESIGIRLVHVTKETFNKDYIYNLTHMIYIKKNSHIQEFGLPYNRKHGDVGFDLHASHDLTIYPEQHVNVGTEVYIDMPYDVYASILLRSSMAQKGLMTHYSLIDPGFRGELKIYVWNFSKNIVQIEKGDRAAQLIIIPRAFVSMVPKTTLSPSIRNATGFGSTGR